MKKLLIFILIICICFNTILLSSCKKSAENSEQETEAQTEKAELKKFADPALFYKLHDGMLTEEVKRALGAAPIKLGDYKDAFIFTNGLVVYVGGSYLQYDNAVNPNMVHQISIGDSYSDVVLDLDATGVNPYNRYGCIAFCLSDGRKLHIEFTPDYFVESFRVSDN